MARKYRVISADSHVNPLPTFWRDYLPQRLQERAPRLEQTDEGDFIVFEGNRRPFGLLGALAGKKYQEYKATGKVSETRPGGWDPQERIKDLDVDGVDAEVLYGGGPLGTSNQELYLASFRAYNTWLAEFCSQAPDRLLGMAYIPMLDVELAVDELKVAVQRGLRGVVIPAFPPAAASEAGGGLGMAGGDPNISYADPKFEPFWKTVVELGVPTHMHLGARRGNLQPERFMEGMLQTKLAMAEPVAHFIFSGLFEKYPDLKLVSVESGVGWFAFAAQYMDHIFHRHKYWTKSTLKEKPSFYMDRQLYGTFLEDPPGIQLRHAPGAGNIMWSSDYPHSETSWPDSLKMIEEICRGIPVKDKEAIVCGTARKLYNL